MLHLVASYHMSATTKKQKNLQSTPRLALYPETHKALEEKKEKTGQSIQFIGNKLLLKALGIKSNT